MQTNYRRTTDHVTEKSKQIFRVDQGFTLTEVLVSILITTLFVATAMQAVVFAAIMKVKAKQYAEATTWIQQDLEGSVKSFASKLQSTSLRETASTGSNLLKVSTVDGFEAGDTLLITQVNRTNGQRDSVQKTIAARGVDSVNKNITLASTLEKDRLVSTDYYTLVVATTKCNPSDPNFGFAKHLWNNLPTINGGNTKQISGRNHTVTRTLDYRKDDSGVPIKPYNILTIAYKVTPEGSDKPVAELYSEVIPDAAFQCP